MYAKSGTEDFNTVSTLAESKAGGRYCESDANGVSSLVLSTGVDNVVRCFFRVGGGRALYIFSRIVIFYLVVFRIKGAALQARARLSITTLLLWMLRPTMRIGDCHEKAVQVVARKVGRTLL